MIQFHFIKIEEIQTTIEQIEQQQHISPWLFIIPVVLTICSILFMIYARKEADPDMLELNKQKYATDDIKGIEIINYKRQKAGKKPADQDLWYMTYYRIIYVKRSQYKISSKIANALDKIPEPYLSRILEEKKNSTLMQNYEESLKKGEKVLEQTAYKFERKQHKKQD